MTAGPARQLALNMQLRDDATLASFLPAPALEPLLAAVRAQAAPAGELLLFLHGSAGSGRSHLLQAACHLLPAASCYLPLAELATLPGEQLLQGLESRQLVCLDDIDAVVGVEAWELALFHFCNRARAAGCRLLLSASASPRQLPVVLPDLQSRLGWGPVFQLPTPDDERKQAILRYRARCRGLDMPAEVSRFLVSRAPRSLADLMALLETLDSRSLAEQRALTVPFVKLVLGF
ncbi:DnaA regulatory inactivator Hda [Haliea sp. E1-2-M8]|uniref:DnaA regulatory inactivator Hda n=1 Tax=Haliea sp. E1-2-M8 TaxID=3064706 RepID=UPI002726C75B|nr:DnaA regulatory inactivator Hda [Haliea sp. E1-2-M8]MDO8862186.1 DnaA regulatory inactivator Hda [Haliea sp. E1-2-M8]